MPERKRPVHLQSVSIGNRPTLIMVTVCTQGRKPILACDTAHQLLRSNWEAAAAWLVGCYVILPDHIHLFCAPNGLQATSIRAWIRFWKTGVSKQWSDPSELPIWQKDFWDRQIRRGEKYSAKWEYIRNNPVRHGLVDNADQWPWQGEMHPLRWHDI